MKLRIALLLALMATPLVVATALGHTGLLTYTQSCQHGTTITARHLA